MPEKLTCITSITNKQSSFKFVNVIQIRTFVKVVMIVID